MQKILFIILFLVKFNSLINFIMLHIIKITLFTFMFYYFINIYFFFVYNYIIVIWNSWAPTRTCSVKHIIYFEEQNNK